MRHAPPGTVATVFAMPPEDATPPRPYSSRPNSTVQRFLKNIEPIQTVIKHELGHDEVIVMLAWGNQYSVCALHPLRRLITAPNYHVSSGTGLLSTSLTRAGLSDLAHWTDRPTALERFRALAEPGANPGGGANVVRLKTRREPPH